MGVTDDRSDPRLTHGSDTEPQDQAEMYLVLSDEQARDRMLATKRMAEEATHSASRMYWSGWSDALAWVRHPDFPARGAS